MKLFKLLLLFAILSTITACGDDDDCVQADWVGVYTGTVTCTEDGVVLDTEDVTVTISAEGSDQISIVYVCLLYTSPSPRDGLLSRMPSSA